MAISRFYKWGLITFITFSVHSAVADVTEDLRDCQRRCSQSCQDIASRLRGQLNDFESACRGDDNSRAVTIHSDDRCNRRVIATLSPQTDCRNLSNEGNTAGAVRFNGTCLNIFDTTVRKACASFKSAAARNAVSIHNSDRCGGRVIARVNPATRCQMLPKDNSHAWAVRFNGKCLNIPDVSPAEACARFAAGNSRNQVVIYNNDGCSSIRIVAVVNPRTNCEALSDSGRDAWAIKPGGGSCRNISDTSLREACATWQASGL